MMKEIVSNNVDPERLLKLLSCAHALVTQEAMSLNLPDFPLDNLPLAAKILVHMYLMIRLIDFRLCDIL